MKTFYYKWKKATNRSRTSLTANLNIIKISKLTLTNAKSFLNSNPIICHKVAIESYFQERLYVKLSSFCVD